MRVLKLAPTWYPSAPARFSLSGSARVLLARSVVAAAMVRLAEATDQPTYVRQAPILR